MFSHGRVKPLWINQNMTVNMQNASWGVVTWWQPHYLTISMSDQFFCDGFLGADRELHQREHEDRDGPAAAERRPQPHGSHVGNGHQPSFSDGRTDTQANWRWDAGNGSSNTLTLMLPNPFLCLSLSHALRASILCSINQTIPCSTALKWSQRTGQGQYQCYINAFSPPLELFGPASFFSVLNEGVWGGGDWKLLSWVGQFLLKH